MTVKYFNAVKKLRLYDLHSVSEGVRLKDQNTVFFKNRLERSEIHFHKVARLAQKFFGYTVNKVIVVISIKAKLHAKNNVKSSLCCLAKSFIAFKIEIDLFVPGHILSCAVSL
jgi:hypothetical protein